MSGSGFGENVSDIDMNMSNISDPFDCRRSFVSTENITDRVFWSADNNSLAGAIVIGVIICIYFLVGSGWNSFITVTFFIKHELLKEPANIFLLSVALTNLFVCFSTMIFVIVTSFAREFIFGNNDRTRCDVCDIAGFFLMFLVFMSLYLLAALSIDRFILLSRPLRYKHYMSRAKAIIISLVISVWCFVIAILPIVGFGQYEFNGRFNACVPRFTPTANLSYIIFTLLAALIPIIVLSVTNIWTYKLVSKFLKRNFRRRSTYRRHGQRDNDESSRHHKQQKQLVKVFGALFIAFIISYTPTVLTTLVFFVVGSSDPQEDPIPEVAYIIGFFSFLTTVVLYPIIESFFVKELRYQINRAKKGVRRVSSSIYKQTTQLFSNKALEEAIRKVEAAEEKEREESEAAGSSQKPKREHRFLNGKRVSSNKYDVSMVTEMEDFNTDMPSSSSPTHDDENESEGEISEVSDNRRKDRPMLNKARRSVTFQENNTAVSPVSNHSHQLSASCLKKGTKIDKIEEDEANKEDARGEGDVFTEPELHGILKHNGRSSSASSSSNQRSSSSDVSASVSPAATSPPPSANTSPPEEPVEPECPPAAAAAAEQQPRSSDEPQEEVTETVADNVSDTSQEELNVTLTIIDGTTENHQENDSDSPV